MAAFDLRYFLKTDTKQTLKKTKARFGCLVRHLLWGPAEPLLLLFKPHF